MVKSSDTRMHRVATLVREFIALDADFKRLKEQRELAQEKLLPLVAAMGQQAWGDKVVKRMVSGGKRATREDIVAFFGGQGKLFWDSIKSAEYEYLTVELKKR